MKAEPSHYTPFDADLRRAGIEPAEIDDLWYGVVIVDRDKRVQLSNRAARRMLGVGVDTKPSEVNLLPVDPSVCCGSPLDSALGGEARWCVSCKLESPRGVTGPVTATSFPVRNADDAIVGAIILCQTHGGWSDEARHALDARTHAAQQRELTSTMAHEVNQPLSAIYMYSRGCLRRLKDGQIDAEELREAMEAIGEQALRAGEIVRKLREYPSGEAGARVIERFDEVLTTALSAARPMGEASGFRFATDLAAGGSRVKVDRARVELAILHLVRNAIEASSAAEAAAEEIEIQTRVTGEEIELRIADRGIGIPEDLADRLMEPFTTTKELNRGLGLSFCKSIAQAHGGRLEIHPRQSGGTEVVLYLPTVSEE